MTRLDQLGNLILQPSNRSLYLFCLLGFLFCLIGPTLRPELFYTLAFFSLFIFPSR